MEEPIFRGKTKDVFRLPDGKLRFVFKDDATGYVLHEGMPTERVVFDSGYDEVVGEIPKKGVISCQFTRYFFELLSEKGLPNHYVQAFPHLNVMIAERAILLGAPNEAKDLEGSTEIYNLEWVFRHGAQGSFWRRYSCIRPCKKLPLTVEIYAKGRPGEPDVLMSEETPVALGIMTQEEVAETKRRTKEIACIMYEEFVKRGFHLIDGKIEWGRRPADREIILIDDLSPDTFKICEGFVPDEYGNCTASKECVETRTEEKKRRIKAKNILTADQQGLKKLAEVFRLEV